MKYTRFRCRHHHLYVGGWLRYVEERTRNQTLAVHGFGAGARFFRDRRTRLYHACPYGVRWVRFLVSSKIGPT